MCGIAGYSSSTSSESRTFIVRKMTDAMAHRGPNSDGFFSAGNITLGHRRLSIIDLSSAANQPFSDQSGRWTIAFNGELFNFKQVKSALNHINFKTTSDTEVLVEALNCWGIDAIRRFKGMFALAAWDHDTAKLYLVRDRLGVKPLYYSFKGKELLFASELRAIMATGLLDRRISNASLQQYLYYQSIGGEQTIVEDIKQLAAGNILEFSSTGVEINSFWDITEPEEKYSFTNKANTQKKIKTLLFESVEQRLISDVPLGAFLSGGIDSSAVVAVMREVSQSRPVTFNISFDEKEFDESIYADEVARKFSTEHHTIKFSPSDFLRDLPSALNAMDTPSGDGVNTYLVSKAVKDAGLTVALSGVGGDELFAGYPFFTRYLKLKKWKRLWSNTHLLRKYASSIVTTEKWKSLLNIKQTDIASVYPVLREVLSKNEIIKLLNSNSIAEDQLFLILNEKLKSICKFPSLSQVSIAEYLGYTQQTLLKDTDQMSMAVSLEVREPFFDHQLIEYVLQVPDEWKYPAYPKQLLVESLGTLLPQNIVHRKKQGFTFPWKHWLRNELKSFGQQNIDSLCDRKYFNADSVRAQWNAFQTGDDSTKWMKLWLLIQMEYWLTKNRIT
ncbi:asparagine synthase (glutamine-hydrolyzing) [Flavihumibacter profundi]|uniref:asparagine synthase (glutamine-hydrolyzing) n=1 Tax=Flavihumibacter profundi TaxID=2716883 RepID=UPI001CC7E899|nr:asparagine synthase (glutamine-hydrolyzing) [Flavihumibacter profundi]MBZ5858006.1 asparagine synthase (glutamine-hydrolyzing) [Flavihumibacter profundi]